MSIQELELAVTRLSKEELATFSQWFEEYIADEWDKQIEADIRAGRFDAAGQRAKADYEAERCTTPHHTMRTAPGVMIAASGLHFSPVAPPFAVAERGGAGA